MSISKLGLSNCLIKRTEVLDIDMEHIRDGEAAIMRQIKITEKVLEMSLEPDIECYRKPRSFVLKRK